jgi:hypothetical protein
MGVKVDTAALPNEIDLEGWFPETVGITHCNLFQMDDDSLLHLFSQEDYDVFVYALGPDDRFIPDFPAYSFFYDRLVVQCKRICLLAKKAKIPRCIILNSYFSTFDKQAGGILSKHHPYIHARRDQENELFAIGETGSFEVMVLELPFIFGLMPSRKPLWRDFFLSHFEGKKHIFFPSGGGTAAIDVSGIAEAVVACAINGENHVAYPIGKINLSFEDLINTMMSALHDPRRYKGVLPFLCRFGGMAIDKKLSKQGKQSGLDHGRLMTEILNKRFFIDASISETALGYPELGFSGGKEVFESIRQTIRACYPEIFQ